MRPKTEASDYTSTLLRLPQPLLDEIRHLAQRERRSLNSELLCAVEEYLERRAPDAGAAPPRRQTLLV